MQLLLYLGRCCHFGQYDKKTHITVFKYQLFTDNRNQIFVHELSYNNVCKWLTNILVFWAVCHIPHQTSLISPPSVIKLNLDFVMEAALINNV